MKGTEPLTKLILERALANNPNGKTLNQIAECFMEHQAEYSLETARSIHEAASLVSIELGTLLTRGKVKLVWQPNSEINYCLPEYLPETNDQRLANNTIIGPAIYYNKDKTVDWSPTVLETIRQRGNIGITSKELWLIFQPWWAGTKVNTARAFNLTLASLKKHQRIHVHNERVNHKHGHYTVGRYFFGKYPESNAKPKPLTKTKGTELLGETETPTAPLTYTNVSRLHIAGTWETNSTFDPPVTILLCLGCPPDRDSLYVPGKTDIVITQLINGRKATVTIQETESLTISVV